MTRQNISSGAIWEDQFGYSRAVRIGNIIEVSGTTAVVDGELIGKGDPYLQAKAILKKVGDALEQCGASFEDVIRTRIYVTDIDYWKNISKAHAEVFKNIKPAATLVAVSALIDPDLLVEIEVTAVVG